MTSSRVRRWLTYLRLTLLLPVPIPVWLILALFVVVAVGAIRAGEWWFFAYGAIFIAVGLTLDWLRRR